MASNIARVDEIRSLGFASINATYDPLGGIFEHAMRILRFINNTDGDLYFSFDGTTDNLFVPARSFVLYDISSNDDPTEQFRIQNRTQIYVRYDTAPTSGSAYLECIYGRGE